MDRIRTDIVGGMPFDAPDLDKLQQNYEAAVFIITRAITGADNVIVLGCEAQDTSISPGWVFLNGELLWFEGAESAELPLLWGKTSITSNPVTTELGETVNSWVSYRAVISPDGVELDRWRPVSQTQINAISELISSLEDADVGHAETLISIAESLEALGARVDELENMGGDYQPVMLGEIKMWAGEISSFDATGLGTGSMAGWALCNGQNGTVDLRERFPAGIRTDGSAFDIIGKKLGSHGFTLSEANIPVHSHSGNTDPGGLHSHSLSAHFAQTSSEVGISVLTPTLPSEVQTDEQGEHTHSFTTSTAGSGLPVNFIAQCTVVAYIQRINV